MGENRKYYDVADYNGWKRNQGKNFRSPPRANYLAAANYIKSFLDGKKLNYAVFGSLAMLCLGSRRQMPDIHIVYDDRDFQRIKAKLETDQRARLPKGMNALFPTKILLGTGPNYKDTGCTENVDVEIEFVPPGSYGTPPNDVMRKNQALLRLNLDGKMNNFKGLNMLYLMETTLRCCRDPNLAWDPRNDIVFLCQSYGQDLEAIRPSLDPKRMHDCFFQRSYYTRLSPEDQRKCSMALLGKELLRSPPPKMAITPPPSGSNATAGQPGTAPRQGLKPTLHSHKSTPNLGHPMDSSSLYLAPPLPGKPRPKPNASSGPHMPQTGAAKQITMQQVGPQAQAHVVPVYSAGADSRSRYRATSAPNTPGHSRNSSRNVEAVGDNGPRSKSLERQGASQPSLGIPSSQPTHNVSRPPMTAGKGPAPINAAPMGLQPQKSMPDLTAVKTTVSHKNSNTLVPNLSSAPTIPSIQSAAFAPLTIPGVNQRDNGEPTLAPNQRHSNYVGLGPAAHTAVPPTAKDPAHGLVAQTRQPEGAHSNSAHPTANASPPRSSEGISPANAGLRIVGPEGLHPPTQKPPQQSGLPTGVHPVALSTQHLTPHPATGQQQFAVELPATVPTPKPRSDSKVASPEISPVKPHSQMEPQSLFDDLTKQPQMSTNYISPPLPSQAIFIQELPAEPVVISPPTATPPVQALQAPFPARPVHPRTHSDPIPGLPASLVAGGATRQRSPQRSVSSLQPPPQSYHGHQYSSNYEFYSSSPPKENAAHSPSYSKSSAESPYQAYQAYPGTGNLPAPAPIPAAAPPAEQMVFSPQQMTPSTSTASTPISSPFNTSGAISPQTVEIRRPFPNPLMANPPTPGLPLDSQTQIDELYLGTTPPSSTKLKPKVPNSPPLITQGYERFAHGPYTPSSSTAGSQPSSASSGKINGVGGVMIGQQQQQHQHQGMMAGEGMKQSYQAYNGGAGQGTANPYAAPRAPTRQDTMPRYYNGQQ